MRRCLACLLIVLLTVCGVCACGDTAENQEKLEDGEYYLYYTNQACTKLQTEVCTADAQGVTELAGFLLGKMQEVSQNMEYVPAIPEDVKVTRTEEGSDGQLFVYFNAAYKNMKSEREIMCRAAVVKTLTQIEGVEFVGFSINDQPLMDASRNTINLMSSSSFVDSAGDTKDLQQQFLTLYFTDESGSSLIETEKTVVCSTGIAMEQLVVDQLLAGVDADGVYDTLPRNAKALSVTVKNGICYVNFDSAFADDALNVSEYIPIYSVVNSLTELPNISRVQISINGVSNIKFRDSISLEQPLERNMDYVKNQGNAESIEETE